LGHNEKCSNQILGKIFNWTEPTDRWPKSPFDRACWCQYSTCPPWGWSRVGDYIHGASAASTSRRRSPPPHLALTALACVWAQRRRHAHLQLLPRALAPTSAAQSANAKSTIIGHHPDLPIAVQVRESVRPPQADGHTTSKNKLPPSSSSSTCLTITDHCLTHSDPDDNAVSFPDLHMTQSLLCYRVLRVPKHPCCRGEDLPQPVDLPCGRHHLR
jgi:hypothetical protein